MSIEITDKDREIAARMRAIRMWKRIPITAIADAIGAKRNTITRVENERSALTASQLVAVAKALGVEVSELVGEKKISGGYES